MSKHIKLRRAPLDPYQGKRADMIGEEYWWGIMPVGAIDHYKCAKLAHQMIRNKNLTKTLYCVSRSYLTVHLQKYTVNIHLAHILVNSNLIFFENYWLAYAFMRQCESKFGR